MTNEYSAGSDRKPLKTQSILRRSSPFEKSVALVAIPEADSFQTPDIARQFHRVFIDRRTERALPLVHLLFGVCDGAFAYAPGPLFARRCGEKRGDWDQGAERCGPGARAKSVPDHLGAQVKFGPDQAETGIGVRSVAVKEMPNGKWAIYHRNTGQRVSVAKNKALAKAAATLARKSDGSYTEQSQYGGEVKERLQELGKLMFNGATDGIVAMYNEAPPT
jgi:hypothetical protein